MTDKRVLTQFEIDALLNKMYDHADHDPPSKWIREAFREVVLPYFNAAEQEPWVDGDVVSGDSTVPRKDRAFYVRRGGKWHEINTGFEFHRRTHSDTDNDHWITNGELVRVELA